LAGKERFVSIQTEPESIDMLFVQVCRLHYGRARTLLEEIGLYRGQPPLLRFLREQDGLAQTDLATRLQLTPATVTKMIQRMEKAGFVQRRPDATDQRVSRVYLTEAGRAIQTEVDRVLQTIEADAFAGFTLDERVVLRRLLLQMRENLLKIVGEKFSL
jgi:DNA-binding MarR family transcriptional regulator